MFTNVPNFEHKSLKDRKIESSNIKEMISPILDLDINNSIPSFNVRGTYVQAVPQQDLTNIEGEKNQLRRKDLTDQRLNSSEINSILSILFNLASIIRRYQSSYYLKINNDYTHQKTHSGIAAFKQTLTDLSNLTTNTSFWKRMGDTNTSVTDSLSKIIPDTITSETDINSKMVQLYDVWKSILKGNQIIYQYYSCHPTKDDIKRFVKELKPKYFIPIQGLYRYLVVATHDARDIGMNLANCLVLQNGKVAEFKDFNLVSQKQTIQNIGHLIIDGFGIGDISSEVIKERENLGRDGVIALSVLIDYKKKMPIGELQINSYGSITKDNKEIIYNIINTLFDKEFKGKQTREINLKNIQEQLRKSIKRKIYKAIDKEPLVVVTLYEI